MDPDDLSGRSFDAVDFIDCDWEGRQVRDADFQSCRFTAVKLGAAQLAACRFVECRFVRCDLSAVRLPDSLVAGCSFADSRLTGIDWTRARWPPHRPYGANQFENCDLSLGEMSGLDLGPLAVLRSRAREVSFRESRMPQADFSGTDCSGADFTGADLNGSRFVGSSGVVLDPRNTEVRGVTVDADLAGRLLAKLEISIEGDPRI